MKKQVILPGLAVMAIIGAAGCSSTPVTLDSLAGTWALASGTGPEGTIDTEGSSPLDLDISPDGEATGSGGCNRIRFTISVEADDQVEFGPLMSTMMACDQPVMDNEAAYTAALEGVDSAKVEKGRLTFSGSNVELVYKPAKK